MTEKEEEYIGICVRCFEPLKSSEVGCEVRGDAVDYQHGQWIEGRQIHTLVCRQCNEEFREAAKRGIRAAVERKNERQALLAAEVAGTPAGTVEIEDPERRDDRSHAQFGDYQ